MGLRERASDYSKDTQENRGVDLGLELKPQSPAQNPTPPTQTSTPQGSNPTERGPSPRNNSPTALPSLAAGSFERQAEAGTPYKARLDAVLNLVEIYKEFGMLRAKGDLWQTVAYSLVAQLGTKYLAIFMQADERMELKHAMGFTLSQDFSFSATHPLVRELRESRKILFVDDIAPGLTESEARFLVSTGARYAVPVFRYEELRGVIFANPASGNPHFNADDLFYLKLCGELLGAMESQLTLVYEATEKSKNFEKAHVYQKYVEEFADALGQRDNNEPLKDVLEKTLLERFPETAFLLLTREDFNLRFHFAVGLPVENVTNLEAPLVDSTIEIIKQGAKRLTIADLERSEVFSFLSRYREVHAHKVLHRREFLGLVFFIDQDTDRIAALSSIVETYILQNHLSKLRDSATSSLNHADNPVMAIKNFIASCEEHLERAQEPFAVIVSSVANYERLLNLHGVALATEVRDFTRRTLHEITEAQDFSTEIFHGHFVTVLRQKEAGDAWRLSRVLQKHAGKTFGDEDSRPIFQHKIYARPHLHSIPFELLFKAG